MCLERIKMFNKSRCKRLNKREYVIAYKVFYKCACDKELKFPFFGETTLSMNKWMKSSNETIRLWRVNNNRQYESGFHVFKTMEGAKNYVSLMGGMVIKTVKVRSVTTVGTQDGYTTYVAKEMYVY